MLELVHILILCVCLWQCFTALQSLQLQFLKFLIFAGIGLIHGLVPAIAPYSSMNAGYEERIEAAFFALCGTLAISLGWMLYDLIARNKQSRQNNTLKAINQATLQKRLEQLFLVAAVVGAVAWPGKIFAVGSTFSEYASEGRLAFRGGGNQIVSWVCSSLMNYAFIPGFLGFFLSKQHRNIGILYALCYAGVYFMVTSGTRSFPIGIAGSVLCGYVLHQAQSLKRLAFLGTCGAALIFLTIGMLPLRWQMNQLSFSEMGQLLVSYETYEDMLVRDPLNYHEYLVEVVGNFPEHHDFVHAASYQRILFFFLPHSSFPNLKPRDPNQIVAELLFNTELDTQWMHPPSFFGDSYINFYGWYGILFMMFEGFSLAWISRKMYSHLIWLLLLGPNLVHFTFLGLRGQPYTLSVYTISMFLYLAFLMKFLRLPFFSLQKRQGSRAPLNHPSVFKRNRSIGVRARKTIGQPTEGPI